MTIGEDRRVVIDTSLVLEVEAMKDIRRGINIEMGRQAESEVVPAEEEEAAAGGGGGDTMTVIQA